MSILNVTSTAGPAVTSQCPCTSKPEKKKRNDFITLERINQEISVRVGCEDKTQM